MSGRNEASGPVRVLLGESGGGVDSAFTRRVRLYLRVTTFINLFFTAIALIIFFSGGDSELQARPAEDLLVIIGVTSVNAMAWFLVSRSRPGWFGSVATAGITTLALSFSYTYVTASAPDDPNPSRSALSALMIVSIVLVLRSSLIPSPTFATVIVGVLSLAFPVSVGRPSVAGGEWVFFTWLTVLALVVVAVTAVTSNVVYGLERRIATATQLGQYQLESLVGHGGMGEVYLARHALLQRPTAIKLLRDATDAEARDRFRQEVQVASGLSHPNTVEIYDYGRTPEGVFYFAMEYVEGATLEDVVSATGAMPAARVNHLLCQASGSLGEAHLRGLVHRDIKPSNLMLCARGGVHDTLKVLDFGLVRDLSQKNKASEQQLTGTPLCLAPEAILQPDGFIPQSDVYALGATAYFLLSGRPPFASENLTELLSDHLAVPPAPIDCDDPGLSELVLRCLAKDPADRPADAQQLHTQLQALDSFGQWRQRDAGIWWAEHQEVVDGHTRA